MEHEKIILNSKNCGECAWVFHTKCELKKCLLFPNKYSKISAEAVWPQALNSNCWFLRDYNYCMGNKWRDKIINKSCMLRTCIRMKSLDMRTIAHPPEKYFCRLNFPAVFNPVDNTWHEHS